LKNFNKKAKDKENRMKLTVKRLLAYGLDFVLLASVLVSLQWTLYLVTGGFPFVRFDAGHEIELWVLLTFSLPVWGYFIWCEGKKQQTAGKFFLRLKVVNAGGAKIRWWQAFLRTLIRLLPWELTHLIILVPEPWWTVEVPENEIWIWVPNVLMAASIAVLFVSKGKKGIHDFAAKTTVVSAGGARG
jgi:uncharacterized RDD family membrane protein YckC